jgi:hypothetical protein
MTRIEELENQVKRLTEENRQLKLKLAKVQDDAQPRCSGCGDYLDGPHHSFCGDREFG